ncbi:serine/threonine-protein kinase [Amnibacterium kyonggiense]|uniref:non-specific serine/threonine protein kinase n=1 Tax=Amnibacterium kyonggiense TaxID=595671 RepID=A0A4V3EAP0_9MICO|nr:serine/threonine-protein kinase [Amnibacterium kyonggiense]TDS77314.1 serine/threonine protein kinase [Amnibacterium kyonggiense]
MSSPIPERGGARVVLPERYRVEHVIGRGGTAVVYAAHDTLLNRPVAIKVFTAPTDSARVLREQQHEAQMLAGLSHHALVTLFDAGVDDTDPDQPHIYLVMERVDGPDLGQALRSGALTPMQVAYLGLDLCDALLYVHERGWLHRDIKPANVLLSGRWSDRRLRGKLSDFGIATVLGSPADDGEFTVGTAAYLSPEQVEGGVLASASDVYSLGLVLLQAATGRVSFPGTVIESAFARLSRDPEIPDSIPPRLAAVLVGMTRRSPSERLQLEEARSQFERSLAEQISSDVATEQPAPAAPAAAPAPVIADVPPDREFARITGIAARLLRTPAAFVVLGDPREEASAFVPEAHRGELVALATKALVVDRSDGWSVADVRDDARTAGAVQLAPVRSMAVQPILDATGARIGVLAVCDALPREFGIEETATLADLAQLVGHEVDLRRAVRRALFSRES